MDRPRRLKLLVAYGRYVRDGNLPPHKHKVRAKTVEMAFQAISTTLTLDGKPSPVETQEGKYEKAISQLLEGYRREDPPPEPKLAVPVSVPNMMYVQGLSGSEKDRCVGDFGLIAFYYLLRVGEYTHHKQSERRRTVQFRLKDVILWHHNTRLDPSLPTKDLLRLCTAATLNISNQKNGHRAQTIHQEALFDTLCPVRALIRRMKHIMRNTTNPETMLGSYFEKGQKMKSITGTLITAAVRRAAKTLHLDNQGFGINNNISSHSLRAGGAMALHLTGADVNTIKKMGRWSSDTFLMYIHEQISHFSKGLSRQMAQHIPFHNVQFQPMKSIPLVYEAPIEDFTKLRL